MSNAKIEDSSLFVGNKNIKTSHRKKTRKLLFQKLYASTFSPVDMAHFDESFFNDVFDFDVDIVYLDTMYRLILEKESYLLKVISILAPKFKVKTMGMCYILPVMIGACEMLYLEEEIPAKVSLNESIEMAKVYGDESSKKIVNGMMNKLYKEFSTIEKELENFDGNSDFILFKK